MTGNFNLFGWDDDCKPRGRGRPAHVPTAQSRNKVMLLLAVGRCAGEIAAALNVTEPTLRKHYFSELKTREEALFRVEGEVLLRLYEQVEDGNVGAMKELGRKLTEATLSDGAFQRRAKQNAQPSTEKREKLGKKEAAVQAAHTPNNDTALGQLIAQRAAMGTKLN